MAIIAGVVVCIVKKNNRSRGAIIAPFNTNTTGVTIGNNIDFSIRSFIKSKFLIYTVKSEIDDISAVYSYLAGIFTTLLSIDFSNHWLIYLYVHVYIFKLKNNAINKLLINRSISYSIWFQFFVNRYPAMHFLYILWST